MAYYFEGTSCEEAWLSCAQKIYEGSQNLLQRTPSRNGDTFELLHTAISIENSHDRYIVSRYPAISICFALAEVVWILNGAKQSSIINYWNPQLRKYSGKTLEYPGAYGYRLSQSFGFNQIEQAYIALKNDRNSRRVVLLIWDPYIDLPHESKPNYYDTPCNICSMLKIRNGKLFWSQIMRSNDLYLGTPYNFIQFTFLHELFASWLELEIGTYSLYCDSLHAYTKDILYLKKSINTQGYPPESLENSDYFHTQFNDTIIFVNSIYKNMEKIVNEPLSLQEHKNLLDSIKSSTAWQNVYRMIMAYAAKKQNNNDLVNFLLSEVSNPVLVQCWKNWTERR